MTIVVALPSVVITLAGSVGEVLTKLAASTTVVEADPLILVVSVETVLLEEVESVVVTVLVGDTLVESVVVAPLVEVVSVVVVDAAPVLVASGTGVTTAAPSKSMRGSSAIMFGTARFCHGKIFVLGIFFKIFGTYSLTSTLTMLLITRTFRPCHHLQANIRHTFSLSNQAKSATNHITYLVDFDQYLM